VIYFLAGGKTMKKQTYSTPKATEVKVTTAINENI